MSEQCRDSRRSLIVECPFCKDPAYDFDLIGLKQHFECGWCDVYNATETVEEERERKRKEGGR